MRRRCSVSDYEAGGKSSTVSVPGFFRSVKNPTAAGIRIRINARQSITAPYVDGNTPELLTPFTSVEYGMLPVAVTAPNMHKNKPGQPQNTTVAIVAIMPVFLLFILFFSKEMISREYTVRGPKMQGTCASPYTSSSA